MKFEAPARISDSILILGKRESCVYLIDGGDGYAILGGGMTYIIPDLINQFAEFKIDLSRI